MTKQTADIGTTMNVSGWGTETYGGKISCYLKSASLFRTDCLLDGEGGLGDYRQFYATGMFCARKEGVDACQGLFVGLLICLYIVCYFVCFQTLPVPK